MSAPIRKSPYQWVALHGILATAGPELAVFAYVKRLGALWYAVAGAITLVFGVLAVVAYQRAREKVAMNVEMPPPPGMRRCWGCGHANPRENLFCGKCGLGARDSVT